MCEPASPQRTTTRRRVGDAGSAATTVFNGSVAAGGGAGHAGGGGAAVAVVAAAGFPVHVSCMAISGGVIATAAGDDACGFPPVTVCVTLPVVLSCLRD